MGANTPTISFGSGFVPDKIVASQRATPGFGSGFACALSTTGLVKCWGSSGQGNLGQENTASISDPSLVPAINLGSGRKAQQLAVGADFVCALLDDAKVKCWGSGQYLGLGRSSTQHLGRDLGQMGDALPYLDFGDSLAVTKIFAGAYHTCAITSDGRLRCWGENIYGQCGGIYDSGDVSTYVLGDDQGSTRFAEVDLGSGRKAVDAALGVRHTCVLLDNATVKCFGGDRSVSSLYVAGELGYEDASDRQAPNLGDHPSFGPVNLGTGLTPVKIFARGTISCAALKEAASSPIRLKCWGNDDGNTGRLGNSGIRTTYEALGTGALANTMGDNLAFIDLGTNASVKDFSLGANVACAELSDGAVKCWGENELGELGSQTDTQTIWGKTQATMGDNLPVVDLD